MTPQIQKRDFAMYIILSIITCGIYTIYFWYKYAEDVNTICEGDGETTTNYIVAFLLGILTCGIYTFYWYYKLAERLQKNAPRYNVIINENGTTILLLLVGSCLLGFLFLIAYYFLIKNFNLLIDSYNNPPVTNYQEQNPTF